MVRADYYLYIFDSFITDRFDRLFVKYCYKYNIHGKKQLNFRDVVISDIALTFCYKCKKSFDIPQNVVFPRYLRCALRNQVKYSILRQIKYVRNKQRDAVYFLQKFGKLLHGQIIDLRTKDPSEELFRLSFDEFDFSPLNKTEKKIIHLFFQKNQKTKEIAEKLNLSVSAVRKYKKKALKKLYKPNLHLWG